MRRRLRLAASSLGCGLLYSHLLSHMLLLLLLSMLLLLLLLLLLSIHQGLLLLLLLLLLLQLVRHGPRRPYVWISLVRAILRSVHGIISVTQWHTTILSHLLPCLHLHLCLCLCVRNLPLILHGLLVSCRHLRIIGHWVCNVSQPHCVCCEMNWMRRDSQIQLCPFFAQEIQIILNLWRENCFPSHRSPVIVASASLPCMVLGDFYGRRRI